MRSERVTRIRAGDIEIEVSASAFASPQETPLQRDTDRCECGHSLAVLHNETGCLRGCDADTCAKTGTEYAHA